MNFIVGIISPYHATAQSSAPASSRPNGISTSVSLRRSARTGETITDAVITALRERLRREAGRARVHRISDELARIGSRCAALAVLDARAAEDIIGYDEDGLPG